jgi:uncharacterized protein YndB with AHSA1/START domain
MSTIQRTHQIRVRAPLHVVFEYVSDLTRHPEWSDGRLEIQELSASPVGIGKEYRSYGEVTLQKRRPNLVRVTEYQPPHRFSFVANDPDAGDISHVFTLTEQGEQVLIERTMTLSFPPILAFLFQILVYPLVGSPSMEKSLRRLKARLEEIHNLPPV